MAYPFGMHEVQCEDDLRRYMLHYFWIQRPILLYVGVEIAVVYIVHQEVQVVVVLETALDFYEVRTLRERLQYVPLTEYRGRFVKF